MRWDLSQLKCYNMCPVEINHIPKIKWSLITLSAQVLSCYLSKCKDPCVCFVLSVIIVICHKSLWQHLLQFESDDYDSIYLLVIIYKFPRHFCRLIGVFFHYCCFCFFKSIAQHRISLWLQHFLQLESDQYKSLYVCMFVSPPQSLGE